MIVLHGYVQTALAPPHQVYDRDAFPAEYRGDAFVALHAERVQRERHEVVLTDGEDQPIGSAGSARRGDLQGDGYPELIVTRAGSTRNSVHIFRNTTVGTTLNFAVVPPLLMLPKTELMP